VNVCKCALQRINEDEKKVVITDRMWARLLSSTNQPSFLNPIDITNKTAPTQHHTSKGKALSPH